MLETIRKAGGLLYLFDDDHPERGVTEAAQALDICKSSAHSLLATLAEIGLLQRTVESRYRLGWRLFALSHVLLTASELRAEARPVIRGLADRFGERVSLGVLEGVQVVFIEKVQETKKIQSLASSIGVAYPAYCRACGKVLLAHCAWPKVKAMLIEEGGLKPLGPNTISTFEEFERELDQIREQGYAYSVEESLPGVCAVGAPVRDHTGSVIAAISMSLPTYSFHAFKEHYRLAIVDSARQISRNLGYIRSAPPNLNAKGKPKVLFPAR